MNTPYVSPINKYGSMRVHSCKDLIEKINLYIGTGEYKNNRQRMNCMLDLFLEHQSNLKTDQDRLSILIFFSEQCFVQLKPLPIMRQSYNTTKYSPDWKAVADGWTCFVCHGKATTRHHLIELQNGGRNAHENIKPLCDSCHSKIHPWLD